MKMEYIIEFIHMIVGTGQAVAVSCGAGYGRTGTALGCYLVSKALSPAIAMARRLNPLPH